MKFSTPVIAALLLSAARNAQAVDDFYFWKLGHLDGPHTDSRALGISRDGRTAVGATVVVDEKRAWRCDIDWIIGTDDGVPPLGNELFVQEDIGVIAPSRPSFAYAASNMITEPTGYDLPNLNLDWGGSTVVGNANIGRNSFALHWLYPVLDSVDEDDYTAIQDFGGGLNDMKGTGVSADGLIMVGTGHTKNGPQGFWADTRVVDLDGNPIPHKLEIQDAVDFSTLKFPQATAVSEDGMTIAGYGTMRKANWAFVTTVLDASTDPITLESTILPVVGGGKFAEAYAMTPDGAYIAGRCDSPQGPQACIWFEDVTTGEWVVKALGALSHQEVNSKATGIANRPGSAVGELMVVGYSLTNQEPSEAFVWTGNPVLEDDEIGYFYDLEYILTKTGVGELSGMGSDWVLNQATGVSADGERIVGWGVNPEGGIEAWVVTKYPYDELVFTHE